MLYIRPSFYDKFKCIADKCTDSCCIGWEINIDNETMDIYNNMPTEFGEKIRENIVENEDGTHSFKLCKDERCPFLNEKNLCDIITDCGEENICYICSEHPRFYNDFPDVTEYGLGLCCEEVCRLLLENDEPLKFVAFEDETECYFENYEDEVESYSKIYNVRNQIYEILELNISYAEKIQRIINFLENYNGEKITISSDYEILQMYKKTEPINDEWIEYFESLKNSIDDILRNEKPFDETSNGDSKYSKILNYVIYRHLMKSAFFDISSFIGCVNFCVSSVRFIKLCDIKTYVENGCVKEIDRINNVKRWSKQIEYSEENVLLLLSVK